MEYSFGWESYIFEELHKLGPLFLFDVSAFFDIFEADLLMFF